MLDASHFAPALLCVHIIACSFEWAMIAIKRLDIGYRKVIRKSVRSDHLIFFFVRFFFVISVMNLNVLPKSTLLFQCHQQIQIFCAPIFIFHYSMGSIQVNWTESYPIHSTNSHAFKDFTFCLQLDFLASSNPLTHIHARTCHKYWIVQFMRWLILLKATQIFYPWQNCKSSSFDSGHSVRQNASEKSHCDNRNDKQIVFLLLFWLQSVRVWVWVWVGMHESAFASGYQIRLIDTTAVSKYGV